MMYSHAKYESAVGKFRARSFTPTTVDLLTPAKQTRWPANQVYGFFLNQKSVKAYLY